MAFKCVFTWKENSIVHIFFHFERPTFLVWKFQHFYLQKIWNRRVVTGIQICWHWLLCWYVVNNQLIYWNCRAKKVGFSKRQKKSTIVNAAMDYWWITMRSHHLVIKTVVGLLMIFESQLEVQVDFGRFNLYQLSS